MSRVGSARNVLQKFPVPNRQNSAALGSNFQVGSRLRKSLCKAAAELTEAKPAAVGSHFPWGHPCCLLELPGLTCRQLRERVAGSIPRAALRSSPAGQHRLQRQKRALKTKHCAGFPWRHLQSALHPLCAGGCAQALVRDPTALLCVSSPGHSCSSSPAAPAAML